jgi:hypothetical protein
MNYQLEAYVRAQIARRRGALPEAAKKKERL